MARLSPANSIEITAKSASGPDAVFPGVLLPEEFSVHPSDRENFIEINPFPLPSLARIWMLASDVANLHADVLTREASATITLTALRKHTTGTARVTGSFPMYLLSRRTSFIASLGEIVETIWTNPVYSCRYPGQKYAPSIHNRVPPLSGLADILSPESAATMIQAVGTASSNTITLTSSGVLSSVFPVNFVTTGDPATDLVNLLRATDCHIEPNFYSFSTVLEDGTTTTTTKGNLVAEAVSGTAPAAAWTNLHSVDGENRASFYVPSDIPAEFIVYFPQKTLNEDGTVTISYVGKSASNDDPGVSSLVEEMYLDVEYLAEQSASYQSLASAIAEAKFGRRSIQEGDLLFAGIVEGFLDATARQIRFVMDHAGAHTLVRFHGRDVYPPEEVSRLLPYSLEIPMLPSPAENDLNALRVLQMCPPDASKQFATGPIVAFTDQVVKYNGKCWLVRLPTLEEKKEAQLPVHITETEVIPYGTCEECAQCYLLTECDPGTEVITTNTDLSAYLTKVVKNPSTGKCYTVTEATTCAESVPVDWVQPDLSYDDCCDSGTGGDGKCWHMENCFNVSDTLTITNNLIEAVKQQLGVTKTDSEIISGGYTFVINSHCYHATAHNTTCTDSEAVTIGDIFETCDKCGYYYLLECPPGGAVLYVRYADFNNRIVDLASYVGKMVRLSDGKCYSVSHVQDGPQSALVDVTIMGEFWDCPTCLSGRYKLSECDSGPAKYTYTNLSEYVGKTVRVGGKCYTVEESSEAGTEEVITLDDPYPFTDCPECQQVYALQNDCHACPDIAVAAPEIVTKTNLILASGKWIKVDGICYNVIVDVTPEGTEGYLTSYQGPYDTCDDCLQSPIAYAEIIEYGEVYTVGAEMKLMQKRNKMIYHNGMLASICPMDPVAIDTGEECTPES